MSLTSRRQHVNMSRGTSSLGRGQASPARFVDFSASIEIAKNSLRISFRYPANFLVWGVLPVLWLLPFIFTGLAFTGGTANPIFEGKTGYSDFIPFIVLGWVVYSYVDSSVWGVGNTLRWYQYAGVLEPMFLIPVPRLSILLGAALAELVATTITTLIQFTLCIVLFGLRFAFTSVLPVLLLMFLMVVAFTGFAFAFAGLILVFKDPSVLTEFVDAVIYILTPVNYSVNVLPAWVQPLSLVVPSTFALIGIREAALAAAGLPQIWTDIAALLILDVTFWLLGIVIFRLAEQHTRKQGKLGAF